MEDSKIEIKLNEKEDGNMDTSKVNNEKEDENMDSTKVNNETKDESMDSTTTSRNNKADNEKKEDLSKQKLSVPFKMPMIIPSKLIKTKSAFSQPQESNMDKAKSATNIEKKPSVQETTPVPQFKPDKPLINKPSKEIPPLTYKEPKWGGKPDKDFSFEVLKCGKIIATIDLTKESYYLFGRLESCNVVFEHPSVSRYHAVLQYREEGDKDNDSGFYIYDLDSTHGTFLNKNQLRPRTYYRVRVGHMIKIGGSSRIHILQGPAEDEEEESELTITEIKELARKKQEEMKLKAEEGNIPNEAVKKDDGIDWGFGEDAIDEPIGDNPFTLTTDIAPNEDLFINDPKKTIRGWFEREGYELEYKVEEKGVAHFTCRIDLPIDPTYCQTYFAEATVKGKKKEAVLACALEACRILDRHGLLRQSHQESRKRKKKKKWEDDDFYDSDEDTFLDRTGTIEKKRELRKKMVTNEVETYDSLREKLNKLENEMEEINKQLQQSSKKPTLSKEDQDEDSLEAYMAAITKANEVDKTKKSRLRLELVNLQKEKQKLVKLVNLARPTSLPPLEIPKDVKKNLPMTGSMKGFKPRMSIVKPKAKTLVQTKVDEIKDNKEDFVEEEEDEDNESEKMERSDEKMSTDDHKMEKSKKEEAKLYEVYEKMETEPSINEESQSDEDTSNDAMEKPDKLKVIGPIIPKEIDMPVSEEVQASENANEDPSNPLNRKRNTERMERRKRAKKGTAGYDPSDPDYAMWLPPENQTGDGKTHLNDKYGY